MGSAGSRFYGKGDVLVYRTHAKPLTGVTPVPESDFSGRSNMLFAANVEVQVWGEAFLPAYTEGDNAAVIATDSMKNFILRHAALYTGATLEGYLAFVGRRLLETYAQMERLALSAREIPFRAAQVYGESGFVQSDLLFARRHGAHMTARLEMERGEGGCAVVSHRSGLSGIELLKLSGNSFAGFVRDEYTTLPDKHDRALFVFLDLDWCYSDAAHLLDDDPAHYIAAEQVVDVAQTLFHQTENRSIQHLMYMMGQRILQRFPQMAEIRFQGQNRTWDTVVEQEGQVRVYTDPRPPYGIQVFAMSRDDLR